MDLHTKYHSIHLCNVFYYNFKTPSVLQQMLLVLFTTDCDAVSVNLPERALRSSTLQINYRQLYVWHVIFYFPSFFVCIMSNMQHWLSTFLLEGQIWFLPLPSLDLYAFFLFKLQKTNRQHIEVCILCNQYCTQLGACLFPRTVYAKSGRVLHFPHLDPAL